jgi:hypothetical protein
MHRRNILPQKISFGLRHHPPHGIGGQEGFLAILRSET